MTIYEFYKTIIIYCFFTWCLHYYVNIEIEFKDMTVASAWIESVNKMIALESALRQIPLALADGFCAKLYKCHWIETG